MTSIRDLKNGDLLIWEGSLNRKRIISYLQLVRFLTSSNYGHVSVVWVKPDGVYHVEAATPTIRMRKLTDIDYVYVIPMEKEVTDIQMSAFFEDKIGLKYSFMDAIRAWLGLTVKDDNQWQCAELCLAFYRFIGLSIQDAYTPEKLVRVIMEDLRKSMVKLFK